MVWGIGFPIELMLTEGSAPINARIDEIVPRGEVATWRAAPAVGNYTSILRGGVQAGMTVWRHCE